MDFGVNESLETLRTAVRELCRDFPDEYWREADREHAYPDAFVRAMTAAGWLGALIPVEYGGLGLSMTDAGAILEEVLLNTMYELPSLADIGECHITGEVVRDNVNPTLVPASEVEQRRKRSA